MVGRILIFIPCFTYGGAEKQGIILARALKERGFEVHVWAFPPIKAISKLEINDLINEGIQCFEFSRWPKYSWKFAEKPWSLHRILSYYRSWYLPLRQIKKLAPKLTFDIIIPFTVPACLLAVLLKRKLKAKAIFWNHRGGNDSAGFHYSPFIIKQILAANPVLMANSSGGAEFLSVLFKKPLGEIKTINNAYLPDALDSNVKLAVLKPQQRIELLQLANFFPEKDWETLVDGMVLLKQRRFYCHLHLVGAFLKVADQELFNNKITALDIADMITYYGSLSKRQILHSLVGRVHIGILSSKTEGMPNVVMEYMYWKLPVIGTDISGIRELLGESQQKYLFKVGDASSFADKIQWLAYEPNRIEKIGDENHKRIKDEFSINKIIPQWIDLIQKYVK